MLKAFAGGFNFAHFAGLGRSSKTAEADLRDQPEAEAAAPAVAETEECEDEDEEEEEMAAGGKKGKKAKKKKPDGDDDENEDETSEGEEDGDDEDEDQEEEAETEDGKKGKKKGAAAAAPNSGTKPSAKAGEYKRGRKAERRRIGLILSHSAAAANLAFACKLACNTGMSSAAAIALLEQTPASGRGGRLDQRMETARVPQVHGGAPKLEGEAAISASWDTAMKDFAPTK